ncbi:hypothetical protein D9M72_531490 [compost metagenome]
MRQRAVERLDLADAAAFLAQVDAVVEAVQAVLLQVVLDCLGVRRVLLDAVAVVRLHLVQHRQRLGVQAPGLQREHADAGAHGFGAAQDGVGQHHVLGRQARGKARAEEARGDAGKALAQFAFLLRQRFDAAGVFRRHPQRGRPQSRHRSGIDHRDFAQHRAHAVSFDCTAPPSVRARRNSGSGSSTEAW